MHARRQAVKSVTGRDQATELYSRMYSFFDRIPDYEITEDEQIQLTWAPRGGGLELWRRQYVASLEQAAVRARALGPAYDIHIWVIRRSSADAQDSSHIQLLVLWRNRERWPEDHYPRPGIDMSCLRYSRGGQLGMVIQHFPDEDSTCEAVTFSHPSRPYKPVRHRITRALPPAQVDRQGGAR